MWGSEISKLQNRETIVISCMCRFTSTSMNVLVQLQNEIYSNYTSYLCNMNAKFDLSIRFDSFFAVLDPQHQFWPLTSLKSRQGNILCVVQPVNTVVED